MTSHLDRASEPLRIPGWVARMRARRLAVAPLLDVEEMRRARLAAPGSAAWSGQRRRGTGTRAVVVLFAFLIALSVVMGHAFLSARVPVMSWERAAIESSYRTERDVLTDILTLDPWMARFLERERRRGGLVDVIAADLRGAQIPRESRAYFESAAADACMAAGLPPSWTGLEARQRLACATLREMRPRAARRDALRILWADTASACSGGSVAAEGIGAGATFPASQTGAFPLDDDVARRLDAAAARAARDAGPGVCGAAS